jgi:hypothetical protein
LLDSVAALARLQRIVVVGSSSLLPLGERETFDAGRNLTLVLQEFGCA